MDAIDGSILQEVEKQLDDMRLGFNLSAQDQTVLDRPILPVNRASFNLRTNCLSKSETTFFA
jgi:hypothetical protein